MQRARLNFKSMGIFWFKAVELRFRVIVFKALVVSAALLALVHLYREAQVETIEVAVAQLASKLLKGAACKTLFRTQQHR